MKSNIALWFFVVIIFIVLGLGFAYVIQQQQVSVAGVRALQERVSGFDEMFKKMDTQLKADADSFKNIRSSMADSDTRNKGLSDKVDNLLHRMEQVDTQLAEMAKAREAVSVTPAPVVPPPAPAVSAAIATTPEAVPAPSAAPVELGTIPVEKQGN